MTLSEILNEIENQKRLENEDTVPQPINGRVPLQEMARVEGLAIAKRQAADRIEELRNLYDRTIYRTSAVVFVTGTDENRSAFLKRAAKDDALCVTTDEFFRRIAEKVEERMVPRRVMSVNVGQDIVQHLARAINQLAPSTFTQYPRLPGQYLDSVIETSEEVLRIVKAVAKPCTEFPLAITWLERNVATLAFEQRFVEEPLAIIVGIDDSEEIPYWTSFFLQRSPSVLANADEGDVETVLTKAKGELRQKM
jgi:hypothetical protein